MIKRLLGVLAVIGLLVLVLPAVQVSAVRGIPGSSEFGFGAYLDLSGQFVQDGVQLANNLQLDWVSLELPWKEVQSSNNGEFDWSHFDPVFNGLARFDIPVMVSLTRPPGWAVSAIGPDPAAVTRIVEQLIQRIDSPIVAVELFPSANTTAGWGAAPDPAAYMALFRTVNARLQAMKNSAILVAGGLSPASAEGSTSGQMDDLEFLKGLYRAGAKDNIQVLSIRLQDLSGSPSSASTGSGGSVLRHYEAVRDVMVKNRHQKSLLWITGLSVPYSQQAKSALPGSLAEQQADWLSQAFQQLRSQLYIGVVFIDQLNPPAAGTPQAGEVPLILASGDLHPAYRVLRDQITQNSSGGTNPRPGRPKSDSLAKGR